MGPETRSSPQAKTRPGGKGKPRGKPFPKGNKLGNRFQPGESGNPEGTSKLQCLSTALRRQLPDNADVLVAKAIKRALRNSRDLEMIWSRAEGSVPKEDQAREASVKVIIIGSENRPRIGSNGHGTLIDASPTDS